MIIGVIAVWWGLSILCREAGTLVLGLISAGTLTGTNAYDYV